MPSLTGPVTLAGRTAAGRLLFGPHETNLGEERSVSSRHVAYYARRAVGGAGIIVTETASVHRSDWPYERAPLASDCGPGWAAVVRACRPHGTLVLGGIGHTGGQGSSAYSQLPLWAPSRVPDSASRELPMAMEDGEIAALVAGFAAAAAAAAAADLDGVEVDAGPGALLRQFHSGLTNLREDGYGTDRLRLTREVLDAVRAELGPGRVLALRLSADELAPWAGVTPQIAAEQVVALRGRLDLLVVTRGGPFSASAYRPDGHTAPGFNTDLARGLREALGGAVPVVLQGSVVDPTAAQAALDAGACDLVEMTRALIADPDLPAKVAAGTPERVRPCVLCNQRCRVRDNRNPIVSCIVEPRSGYEWQDADPEPPAASWPGPTASAGGARAVLVVGAGPGGLEAARVLAGRGHPVALREAAPAAGGALVLAARLPGRSRMADAVTWWLAECDRLGVDLELGSAVGLPDLEAAEGAGTAVLLATGGRRGPRRYAVADDAVVLDDADLLAAAAGGGTVADPLPDGPVLVLDAVGGPIALGLAELLAEAGRAVGVVTGDQVIGTLLAMSGDLADGNTRLLRAGVVRHTSMLLRAVHPGHAVLEDRFSGERLEVPCAAVVHCGHRLPEEALYLAGTAGLSVGPTRLGDCVAPRGVAEAVLEARRTALAIHAGEQIGSRPTTTVGAGPGSGAGADGEVAR